jgi:hypothetical protein
VIEQYPIAATPKYNFPQSTMDATLPRRLIELSLHSLEQAPTKNFQLYPQHVQQFSNMEAYDQVLKVEPKPLLLKPQRCDNIIAAVDTSTINIGETETGMMIAIRAAGVWKQDNQYRYMRFGPFIFHVTEDNRKQVYEILERTYFNSSSDLGHQSAPTFLQMPMRTASLLERWLQTVMAKTMNNGLILFDGSLTAGTPENPTHRMKEILATARRQNNVVLAFSKITSLRLNGRLITDLLSEHSPPYLLKTDGLRPKPPMVLLGDLYVARLTKGKISFRLDIDKEVPFERKIEAVQRLLGSDVFTDSYPETLRLAHILCTFTANEVLAMQHYVTRKFGLRIINRPDMHRLLFGVYGKGEGSNS